jgi:hypothetical protein
MTVRAVRRRWWCAGSGWSGVFRYEDTDGEPLPQAPDVGYVTGDTPAGAWQALAALVAGAG